MNRVFTRCRETGKGSGRCVGFKGRGVSADGDRLGCGLNPGHGVDRNSFMGGEYGRIGYLGEGSIGIVYS